MHKSIMLMIIVALVLTNYYGYTQINSVNSTNKIMKSWEEGFGRQVFKAFQINDEVLYASLQPAIQEYKALLQEMLAANVKGLTQQKIDEMIEQRKREATDRFKKDFEELRAQGDSAGIIWVNAVYESYQWQEIYPEEFHGDIWFTVKGTRYFVEDVQAIEIPAGYRLQRIKGIRKAEEIN